MTRSEEQESIRSWWTKKTKKVGRMILVSSIISMIGALMFFRYAPAEIVSRIQAFNGAMTIPVAGAIWLAAFVFQFLIPSREVAFRSQETLERTEKRLAESLGALNSFMKDQAVPAVEACRHMAHLFETQYFKDIQSTIYVCQYAAKNAVETAKKTETMAVEIHRDALPAIASAARILATLEKALDGGILDRLNQAVETASTLGPVKGGATAPDLARSIGVMRSSVQKFKKDRPPAPPPAVKAEPPPLPEVQISPIHEALSVKAETTPDAPPPEYPRIRAIPVNETVLVAERSRS